VTPFNCAAPQTIRNFAACCVR